MIHADSGADNLAAATNRNDSNDCGDKDLGQAVPKSSICDGQASFPDVRVRLSPTLSRYWLPQPQALDKHIQAVRISLQFLDLAPDRITFPLYAYLWRVLVDTVRYSVFLVGSSGIGKTEISALLVQHVGPGMDSDHLPESFASTQNALAATGHEAKNVPLVVDDFVPTGSKGKIQRIHDQAEYVIRNQGNRAGRNRCTRDGTTLGGKEPLGGFIFSGEEAPQGVSLGARYFCLEAERGDILDSTDPSKNAEIRRYQELAEQGWPALATSGFLQWLAPKYDEVRRDLVKQRLEFREIFRGKSTHPRVVDNAADLLAGFDCFLHYALIIGAIDKAEHDSLWERAHDALFELLKAQEQHQVEQDPAKRVIGLLISGLATGRCHVVIENNEEFDEFGYHRIWGYEKKTIRVPINPRENPVDGGTGEARAPEFEEKDLYFARGEQVGWRRHDRLDLDPDKALGVVQRMATEAGQPPIPVGKKALGKRLFEHGLLGSKGKDRNTTKVAIEGVYREVWHLNVFRVYDFLRSWESWAEVRNEENLREFEEFVQRQREREKVQEARKRLASTHFERDLIRLLDLVPVDEQSSPQPAGPTEGPWDEDDESLLA